MIVRSIAQPLVMAWHFAQSLAEEVRKRAVPDLTTEAIALGRDERLQAILRDPVMQSPCVLQTFISQLANRPTS